MNLIDLYLDRLDTISFPDGLRIKGKTVTPCNLYGNLLLEDCQHPIGILSHDKNVARDYDYDSRFHLFIRKPAVGSANRYDRFRILYWGYEDKTERR